MKLKMIEEEEGKTVRPHEADVALRFVHNMYGSRERSWPPI
jgi:hypothetical protein